jgi:hypothetical protein
MFFTLSDFFLNHDLGANLYDLLDQSDDVNLNYYDDLNFNYYDDLNFNHYDYLNFDDYFLKSARSTTAVRH